MKIRLLPLVVIVALLASGCELFGLDDSELEINVPEQGFTFEIPFDSLPISGEVPQGGALDQWLGTPPKSVDLVDWEPRLAKYQDHVNRLEIRKISYRIVTNSMSGDLPPLEFHFAPAGAVSETELDPTENSKVVEYGRTGDIVAGVTHSEMQTIETTPAASEQVGDLMSSLSFASIIGMHLALAEGDAIPSGKLEVEIKLQLTVFVDAF